MAVTEAASRAPANRHRASTQRHSARGALPEHTVAGVAIARVRELSGSYLATPGCVRSGYRPSTDGLDRNEATSRERAGDLIRDGGEPVA